MKKILQPMTLIMVLSFMLSGMSFAQELQLTRPASTGEVPEYTTKDGGFWINYWEGAGDVAEGALGLSAEETVPWHAAIRWMPEDLTAFAGWSVSKIRVFIYDEPEYGSVMIWQGDIDNPVVMIDQSMMVGEEVWVEVELFDPYPIDITQELWIGWQMGDPGDGVFPAAYTGGSQFSPKSDLLQFGTNPWQPAANFGFDVIWNIEAYVVPGDPIEDYTVTFDVKDEDGNDIDNASIVLGPFEGEPGVYVFDNVPAGIHEYIVTAPDYITVEGEVEVVDEDVTVEIVMETPEFYTVTFHVEDLAGEVIDNATIVLGTFTNEEGDYVFEDVPGDTYEFTVTAPGYRPYHGEVTVDDDKDVEVTMEETELFTVTFNVDMNDVEDFDPEEHKVFLTGTFTDWAEPGTEGSYEMTLVENGEAKDEAPPYTFYENWSGYDDFVIDLSPWITLRLTEGNNWGASDFSYPPHEGTDFSWLSFNPALTDPAIDEEHPPIDGERYVIAVQYMDLDDDKWLISPEFSINETSELSFYGKSITAAYGLERIRVLVSTSGEDPGNFVPISTEPYIEVPTDWTQYTFDLSDYAGEVIRFAINYVSHDAFIFMLDAIMLDAEVEDNGDPDPDPDPEDLIYTVTIQVPEGEAQYKYFSDAFGAGWAGGEWDGENNRIIDVFEDMVLNDVWGDEPEPPVSVVEVEIEDQFMKLFPNPASSILNIASDYEILNVAVYDITGRLLIQDNNEIVNVSNLRNGLYIIQVTTTAGTESHRFHVAR